MATPSNRVPVRIARGSKANLDTAMSAGDLKEGEICYAVDEDSIYVVEGGVLTQAGSSVDLGTESINALSDVDTTTAAPTDGQALIWNNLGGKWEPGPSASAVDDLTDVNLTSLLNYTGFEPGDPQPTDYDTTIPSANQGVLTTVGGTTVWSIPYGTGGLILADGSALVGFLSTNGRYDVFSVRIRSDEDINGNNRLPIGGNRMNILDSREGLAIYTRASGFAVYGDPDGTGDAWTEVGTLPTMVADTWYEVTTVLDWGSAQRATAPRISVWVDGNIAVNNFDLDGVIDYIELTGSEANNFRFASQTNSDSSAGNKYWDTVRTATADTLPWEMSDATVSDPASLMESEYALSDGDVLTWVEADNEWKAKPPAGGGASTFSIQGADDFGLDSGPAAATFSTSVGGTPSSEGEYSLQSSYLLWASTGPEHAKMQLLQNGDSFTADSGSGPSSHTIIEGPASNGGTSWYLRTNQPNFNPTGSGPLVIESALFGTADVPPSDGDILRWSGTDNAFKPSSDYISLTDLKTEVAASADFADFQTRVAGL